MSGRVVHRDLAAPARGRSFDRERHVHRQSVAGAFPLLALQLARQVPPRTPSFNKVLFTSCELDVPPLPQLRGPCPLERLKGESREVGGAR